MHRLLPRLPLNTPLQLQSLCLLGLCLLGLLLSGCERGEEEKLPPLKIEQLQGSTARSYSLRDAKGTRTWVLKRRGSTRILANAASHMRAKASIRRGKNKSVLRASRGNIAAYALHLTDPVGAIAVEDLKGHRLAILSPTTDGFLLSAEDGTPLRLFEITPEHVVSRPPPSVEDKPNPPKSNTPPLKSEETTPNPSNALLQGALKGQPQLPDTLEPKDAEPKDTEAKDAEAKDAEPKDAESNEFTAQTPTKEHPVMTIREVKLPSGLRQIQAFTEGSEKPLQTLESGAGFGPLGMALLMVEDLPPMVRLGLATQVNSPKSNKQDTEADPQQDDKETAQDPEQDPE